MGELTCCLLSAAAIRTMLDYTVVSLTAKMKE